MVKRKDKMNKDIKKAWVYKGRKCVILWVHNHYCAYVETTLKDVSYSQEFGSYETSPSSNIYAHGGVTFSGKLEITPFEKDIWYFGMDFAHAGDYIEGVKISKDEHKWTLEEVKKQTELMADSILVYEKIYSKYKKAFEKFKKDIEEITEAYQET